MKKTVSSYLNNKKNIQGIYTQNLLLWQNNNDEIPVWIKNMEIKETINVTKGIIIIV